MATYSEFLGNQGENKEAAEVQNVLYQTLYGRSVPDDVLHEIKNRREFYERTIKQ